MTEKQGRPKKVTMPKEAIWQRYLELGTLKAVAVELQVTDRTIKNYLRGLTKKRGRKKDKKLNTPLVVWIADRKATKKPIAFNKTYPKTYEALRKEALSLGNVLPFSLSIFIRFMTTRHNEEIRKIRLALFAYLKANKAVADVKHRLLPTAAIRYVVLGKVKFDKRVNVYLTLRDGTKARLFFPYTPRIIEEPIDFCTGLE